MSARAQFAAFWVGIAAVVALGVALTGIARPGGSAAQAENRSAVAAIDVDTASCGGDWGAGAGTVPGGAQSFEITNGSIAGVEVYLENAETKQVYLDLESVGAASSTAAHAVLDRGRYRFVCFPAEADPVVGPTVKVGAAPSGSVLTPGVVPITQNDLIPVAKAYGAWVDGRLPTLKAQVATLDADLAGGDPDPARARADWLAAHLTYETLGAAYGAFGDLDAAINGTPASGTTALSDPGLTGFHKVEALLWSGAPAAQTKTAADALVGAVADLIAAPETDRIDPLDIGLRAHEIVENAVQFELTGDTDAGSHSNLATTDANLQGAAEALAVLEPLLRGRYPQLAQTEAALAAARQTVAAFRDRAGTWRALSSLSTAERQRLDAAVSGTVELLAPIAEITEPRKAAP